MPKYKATPSFPLGYLQKKQNLETCRNSPVCHYSLRSPLHIARKYPKASHIRQNCLYKVKRKLDTGPNDCPKYFEGSQLR